jgi:YD repeat-containing protein
MEQYTYYKNNLLKTLVNKNAVGTVLESYSYTYDLANNQISKSDSKGVTEYSYDVLNRLSTVKEPGGKLTEYKFDMAGNRTNETVTLGTQKTTTLYEYNEQNRMISTTTQVNNERDVTKYSYDGNGNLTSKTMEIVKKIDPVNPPTPHFGMFIPGQAEGGVTEYANEIVSGISYYSYDGLNRMIKALPIGASAAEYRYNGEGLRVEKISDGKTTRYMYEYDKVALELDEKGTEIARNTHGLNPISRTVDGTTVYYLYNGHADVTALIDGAGTIQGTYYYDAFGNISETTGALNNPFTYAGYQFDKETGLYYLNARMYDPKAALIVMHS